MSEDFDHKAGSGQVRAYPWPDSPVDQGRQDQGQQVRECLGDPGDGPGQCPVEPDTGQERRFYVYFLRRPDKEDPIGTGNGCPFYVGKGSNGRHLDHRKEAESLKHKSGKKSLKIKIIHKLWKQELDFTEDLFSDDLTEQEAFELEIEAINEYGRMNNGTGCLANMTDGGEGGSGHVVSNEARQLIGKANKGKVLLKETIDKIKEARKRQICSDETRLKMSISRSGENNPRYGTKLSLEIRLKISKTLTGRPGRPHNEETKEKIRKSNIGKKRSLKTRENISKAMKGKGHPHTEEDKEKIRKALQGKPKSEKHKERQKYTWRIKRWDEIIRRYFDILF